MAKPKSVRTAVIDVGTLKSKFEIREFDQNFNAKTIYKDKQLTVLGRDLDKTDGMIVEESIVKAVNALKEFKSKIEEFNVDDYVAVTTEAIRKAKNSKEVLERIYKETGITLKTLSHEDEAELYFRSVSQDFKGKAIAVSDIGGGSVQVVIGRDDEIYAKYLFKTGTYFLQEGFSKTHHPTMDEVKNAFEYVKSELASLKGESSGPELLVYGSTNIIDFFRAMNVEMDEGGEGNHRHYSDIKALVPVYEKIIALSYEDRMPLYPDEPYYMWAADKALMNIFAISEYLNINRIVPSNNNISSGLLLELAKKLLN